jgi:hypothetical protein
VKELDETGNGIGENGFLFRSLNHGRTTFVDAPMTSDTLRKRLQKRLKDAGLFEGETVHSFRRSAVQHAAVNLNYNVKQLMESGRRKSYSAFRVYVEEVWRRKRILLTVLTCFSQAFYLTTCPADCGVQSAALHDQ